MLFSHHRLTAQIGVTDYEYDAKVRALRLPALVNPKRGEANQKDSAQETR